MDNVFNWLVDNKQMLLNKVIYKMIPNSRDAEDMYQDLFIILAGKDSVKMNKIYDNDELGAYVYIILRNNLESVNSRYYYTYRKPLGFEYDENKDSREITENNNELLLQEIESDWSNLRQSINDEVSKDSDTDCKALMYKGLFDLFYSQDMTYREISAKIGIPTTTVFNYVTETKNKVFPKFNEETKRLKDKIKLYKQEQ